MIPFISSIAILMFICIFHFSGVIQISKNIKIYIENAVSVFKDENLNDLDREKEIQRASLNLQWQYLAGFRRLASFEAYLGDAERIFHRNVRVASSFQAVEEITQQRY